MSGLAFLALLVGLSLLGWLVLWARVREPRAWDSQMREFNRTLEALSPEGPAPKSHRPPAGQRPRGRRAA